MLRQERTVQVRGRIEMVARSTGFEPVTPEVITLGTLAGLSYERVVVARGVGLAPTKPPGFDPRRSTIEQSPQFVIARADTSTSAASVSCDPSEQFQGPSLALCTAPRPQSQGGAVAPHVRGRRPTPEAQPRSERSGPPHRCHPASCPEKMNQRRGLVGLPERLEECRRGRRSSASGRRGTSVQRQWEVFMAVNIPQVFGVCNTPLFQGVAR